MRARKKAPGGGLVEHLLGLQRDTSAGEEVEEHVLVDVVVGLVDVGDLAEV